MKDKRISIIKVFVILFLVVSVICPLITVFLNIRMDDVADIVQAPQFASMLLNSIVLTLISTCISVALAFVLAWCLNRTKIRFRDVYKRQSFLWTILYIPVFCKYRIQWLCYYICNYVDDTTNVYVNLSGISRQYRICNFWYYRGTGSFSFFAPWSFCF